MKASVLSAPAADEITPVSSRVMKLFLEGYSHQEIEEMTGQSASNIYRILKDPVFIQMKNDLLEISEGEIEMAYIKAVEYYKLGLRGEKLTPAQIDFVKLCFKHIKVRHDSGIRVNMTAEDLVLQILTGPLPESVEAGPPKQYERR